MNIFYSFNITRLYTKLIHFLPVECNIVIYILHLFYKTFALKGAHLIPAHAFNLRVAYCFFPVFQCYSCHFSLLLFYSHF